MPPPPLPAIPAAALAPFGLLLLLIAVMPLTPPRVKHVWDRFYPAVSLGLAALVAAYYLVVVPGGALALDHTLGDYASFICLIGSLFVVAGGIHLRVKGEATPAVNVAFLAVGAVIANLIGTTGASMVLVRPWIRMNKVRASAYHVVFFIFLVSNVGGSLTPIGDPPLFLGYLQGIPFWWVARHCWPMWATGAGLLLAIYFTVDTVHARRAAPAPPADEPAPAGWELAGAANLFWLAVIVGAVFLPPFWREGLMLAAAAIAFFTTPKAVHAANEFSFHPVIEVAVLFAGIFATMIPALAWLDRHPAALLGPGPAPGTYYWATGGLSAVLDNAPTYLAFLSTLGAGTAGPPDAALLARGPAQVLAISVGAVFFGAATYIGNGPNFMVKAIAEQRGLRTPAFVEFIWKFSLPFLLPVLAIVWWLFFRD